MPVQVIVDSNFLMMPVQLGIDVFEQMEATLNRRVQPVMLSPVHEELKRIADGPKLKQGRQAKLALSFVDRCKLIDVKLGEGETTDDLIVRKACELGCPVATNDRELRKKLRGSNVAVIYLRGDNRLQLDGGLL